MSRSGRGLTLIELMMAGTIFAVLMTGMVLHLRGGAVAWHRATRTVEDLQQVRVSLERLSEDLVNAVVVDPRPEATPPTRLRHETLAFYTIRRDPRGSDGNATVRFVTYALTHEATGLTLVRTSQTIPEARTAPPAPDQFQELLTGVERMEIRYGFLAEDGQETIDWRPDDWEDHGSLPRLVEVTLERRGASSTPRAIRQVIQIPSGRLGQAQQPS